MFRFVLLGIVLSVSQISFARCMLSGISFSEESISGYRTCLAGAWLTQEEITESKGYGSCVIDIREFSTKNRNSLLAYTESKELCFERANKVAEAERVYSRDSSGSSIEVSMKYNFIPNTKK